MATKTAWVRLSPSEGRRLGFTEKARRYVKASDLARAKRGERVETISDRQRVQGETGLTKEKRTKLLRTGKAKYKTVQAHEAVKYKRRTWKVRAAIPEITRRDLKIIDEKIQKGWNAMSEADKTRFRNLWAIYPRDEILAALGSPETK